MISVVAHDFHEERNRVLEGEWFAYLQRERWDSEDLFQTSRRVLLLASLRDSNNSRKVAGALLGVSNRTMCHHLKKWGMTKEYKKYKEREVKP